MARGSTEYIMTAYTESAGDMLEVDCFYPVIG